MREYEVRGREVRGCEVRVCEVRGYEVRGCEGRIIGGNINAILPKGICIDSTDGLHLIQNKLRK